MDDKYQKLVKRVDDLEKTIKFMQRLTDDFTKKQVIKHEVQYKQKVYDKDGVAVIN